VQDAGADDGLVAVKQNRAGNFNFGQTMPDIREGDTLQPGMPVADIMDLSEIESLGERSANWIAPI
jgi:hypothetical protein